MADCTGRFYQFVDYFHIQIPGVYGEKPELGTSRTLVGAGNRFANRNFFFHVPGDFLCNRRVPGTGRGAEKSAECGPVHLLLSAAHRRTDCAV